ncbi:hypothetical protein, partial [Collinsella aerofaciens]|uniref:hypothetical protein n=1 Tax=Collinsella aerofaciens TaxID=74426 RepID=UPI001C01EE0F
TGGRDVPGGEAGEPSSDADPAAGEPTTEPTANPSLKPAAATTKTTTTSKTTITKTTISTSSRPKTATETTATLPKAGDNNWIAASLSLFLLGLALFGAAYRC